MTKMSELVFPSSRKNSVTENAIRFPSGENRGSDTFLILYRSAMVNARFLGERGDGGEHDQQQDEDSFHMSSSQMRIGGSRAGDRSGTRSLYDPR